MPAVSGAAWASLLPLADVMELEIDEDLVMLLVLRKSFDNYACPIERAAGLELV